MKKSGVYTFVFTFVIASIIFVSSVNLDLNHDGVVNITDIQILAAHFEGKATYNSTFDLNNDSKIDLFDVVKLAKGINLSSGSYIGGSSNVTPIFSDGFESGNRSYTKNGVSWSPETGEGDVFVSSSNPYSGNYSLEFEYKNKTDPCADNTAEQLFYFPNISEVWIEYEFYLPANFYHRTPTTCPDAAYPSSSNGVNNKFLRVWGPTESAYGQIDPQGGASFDPTTELGGGTPGDSFVYLQWGDYNSVMLGPQNPASRWNPAFTDADRGTWMNIKWHLKLSSADGVSDGTEQLWVNNNLTVSLTGLDWHTEAGVGNWFNTGYLMGWANSGYTNTTRFYIDDFKIYDKDPGW